MFKITHFSGFCLDLKKGTRLGVGNVFQSTDRIRKNQSLAGRSISNQLFTGSSIRIQTDLYLKVLFGSHLILILNQDPDQSDYILNKSFASVPNLILWIRLITFLNPSNSQNFLKSENFKRPLQACHFAHKPII